ncbi:putative serine esterase-domain-containing protein, partial [Chytriomyces sp. MP71]
HLWVLHHGLWGDETHLDYVIEHIQRKASERGERIEILNIAASRQGTWTYAGLDGCGAKVVHLVGRRVADCGRGAVCQVSFVGYSLGGLVLRYAIGVLFAQRAFFQRAKPRWFVTFASPHIGAVRRSSENAVLAALVPLGSVLVARTGAQVLLRD